MLSHPAKGKGVPQFFHREPCQEKKKDTVMKFFRWSNGANKTLQVERKDVFVAAVEPVRGDEPYEKILTYVGE